MKDADVEKGTWLLQKNDLIELLPTGTSTSRKEKIIYLSADSLVTQQTISDQQNDLTITLCFSR